MTEVGQGLDFPVAIELASVGKIYVAREPAKARRNNVAIKTIFVTTELAATESSVAHDKVGHVQVRRTQLMHKARDNAHDRHPMREAKHTTCA